MGFQWRSALLQSGAFLGIQHGFRLATEPGTREGLKGPFWRDYRDSVTSLGGWSDGDPFLVNFVGHPMEGAVAGFIQVQNDPQYRRAQFGASDYWRSRVRAMGFAALYSTQFELGPISEASIGNVQKGPPRSGGIVDLVVTPTCGTGWLIAEDALDRYLVRRIESWTDSPWVKLIARSSLNPSRTFANVLRLKKPWYRDDRGGVGRR
jgi:hypothetical protein